MINTKRVYEAVSSTDGTRLLVERLWPRGVKKTSLKITGWPKDVAPSTELRLWLAIGWLWLAWTVVDLADRDLIPTRREPRRL